MCFCAYFFRLFFAVTAFVSLTLQASQAKRDGHFDDVLLVINFNHPFYGNIDFLEEIYSNIFPNIVYYGVKEDPRVIQIDDYRGWWNHGSMLDAVIRFPGYSGYLFLQDDCFTNFWNLYKHDKDKVWFKNKFAICPLDVVGIAWPWWDKPFGRAAALIAVQQLPEKHQLILTKNLGLNRAAFAWSDFFYLPGRLREDYIQAAACFLAPKVFCEISIPTILSAIEPRKDWNYMKCAWGGNVFEKYSPDLDWIHPLKFSDEATREFVRQVIANYGYENE